MSVADLTGTTWQFNETIDVTNCPTSYISFISDGANYEGIGYIAIPPVNIRGLNYALEGQDPSASLSVLTYYYDEFSGTWSWPNQAYRTIEITGGTDATNATLIAWLEANATQVIAGNTYEITHSLSHVTAGPFTIHIEPDTGYTYPESVTVTNGTLVSYDSTTGTAVVEGDDTTVIEAECVAVTPSGYTVNIVAWSDRAQGGTFGTYKANGGSATGIPDFSTYYGNASQITKAVVEGTCAVLQNVSTLLVSLVGDAVNTLYIYDSTFVNLGSSTGRVTVIYEPDPDEDISSYLSEGCYIIAEQNDD